MGGPENHNETYSKVVDKVAGSLEHAGIAPDRILRSVKGAVDTVNRELDSITQEMNRRAQRTQTNYAAGNNRQNGSQTRYGYVPPAGSKPAGQSRPSSGYVRPVPPPARPAAPRTPVPPRGTVPLRTAPVQRPPQPKMVMKRKPSNAKFWFVGILAMIYAMNFPMYHYTHFAGLAATAAVAYCLAAFVLFKGKKVFVPVEEEKPAVEEKAPEPEKKSTTGNPEVDKIIEEGQEYMKKLRAANDRIPDEVMSERISRMENASADIFALIAENPDKAPQIRRFMNYYLPTTLKLLQSYDKLSRQRVKGENIQKTMFEIEGIMETIAAAFEKQLDSLFGSDAMDIAADISVMESILQQEGLAGEEAPPVSAVSSGGAAAAEAPASGGFGMPTLTLDPNAQDNDTKSN